MTSHPRGNLGQQLQVIWDGGVVSGMADAELLERYLTREGNVRELAFEAIVERHGPMVMRTCRGILHDDHSAEDAFQATFFILAMKASALRPRATLGPWLHTAALRVSLSARSAATRRRRKEDQVARIKVSDYFDPEWDDGATIVHEELGRLPERFRAAIVMCDLEGLTTDQAAAQLGWPVGTVRSRLSRGRDRLRARFVRRGLGPEAGAIILAGSPAKSLLQPLVRQAVRIAVDTSIGGASLAASQLTSFVKGALFAMFLTKLKYVAIVSTFVLVIATGAGMMTWSAIADNQKEEPSKKFQIEQTDPRKGDSAVAKGSDIEKRVIAPEDAKKAEEQEREDWNTFVDDEIKIERLQNELETLRGEIRNYRNALAREILNSLPVEDKHRAYFDKQRENLRMLVQACEHKFNDRARELLETKRRHQELLPRYGKYRLVPPPIDRPEEFEPEPTPSVLGQRLSDIEKKLDMLIGTMKNQ